MALSPTDPVCEWMDEVSRHLPHLSGSQVRLLAWWSYATVMCQTSGISTVCAFLATLFTQSETNLRQRLREWTYEAQAKRGDHRQTVVVESCFIPLLRWVLAKWDPNDKRLALAIDASTLGQRFTVLRVSVVYGGCAIPIGWVMTVANRPGAWKPLWIQLLLHYQAVVPETWTVVVFADRGLYAKWLYQTIQRVGWHPCLRINQQGLYHPQNGGYSRPLSSAVPEVGMAWCGAVVCFTEQPAPCSRSGRRDIKTRGCWSPISLRKKPKPRGIGCAVGSSVDSRISSGEDGNGSPGCVAARRAERRRGHHIGLIADGITPQ